MPTYKAKVERWCTREKGAQPERSNAYMLIDADRIEEAFEIAKVHAETSAELGPKWESFEVLSCERVWLPHTFTIEEIGLRR